MRGAQALVAVQLDMDVHKDPAACGAGFQIMIAPHPGPGRGDLADALHDGRVGAAIHQRIPCPLADPQRAHHQHPRRAQGHDRIHRCHVIARRYPQRRDRADIGQQIPKVMQAVRRHHTAAGAPRHTALPPDQTQRQQDRQAHHHDPHAFRGQRHRLGRDQPIHRPPANGPGGNHDEHGLRQRRQILGRGVAKGVVLIRWLGRIEDRRHRPQTDHQVHRTVGQRRRHRQGPGRPQCPKLQHHQQERNDDRCQPRRDVHFDGCRQGHCSGSKSGRPTR